MGGACTFCRIASDFLSYSELLNNRTEKRHITHLTHCLFLSFLDYNVLKLLLEIYDMQNTTTSEICCTSGNANHFSNLCSRWGLSVLQVIILDILFYLTHKFRTLASHTCTSLSFLSEAVCFR